MMKTMMMMIMTMMILKIMVIGWDNMTWEWGCLILNE